LNQKSVHEANVIDMLDKTLSKAISLCDIYYNRSIAYMNMYEYDAAISDLETVMKIASKDEKQKQSMPQYIFAYAVVLFYAGKVQESLDQANKLIEMIKKEKSSLLPACYVQRASCYDRLYKYEEASQDRETAQKLSPNMHVNPLYIRLLSDDAIEAVMSFLDKGTRVSVAATCRQLRVITGKTVYNPIMDLLIHEVYDVIDDNTLKDDPDFSKLEANQMKILLRNSLARDFMVYATLQEPSRKVFDYRPTLQAWINHDPTRREKEGKEIVTYLKELDPICRFGLPKKLLELLEEDGMTFGEILF
jgi:tetratricopeptide (TPR) repeat protein